MTLSRIEVRRAEPDDAASVAVAAAVLRADDAIRNPGDPEIGPRELHATLFRSAPDRHQTVFTATTDGQPAGVVLATTESDPSDDLQLAAVEVLVLPETRRLGVAHALVDAVVPALAAMGQNSILAYSCREITPGAGEALCRSYAMTERQDERCSRVAVNDIDLDLMQSWTTAPKAKTAGYRIKSWVDVGSDADRDRLTDLWCRAMVGMVDAPLDDLDFNYPTRDVDAQRQADTEHIEAGYRMFRTVALTADGEPAGLSELCVHSERPQLARQNDTTVLTGHRGLRLGRWLKAANYLHTLAHVPGLATLETYNAQSNSPMLDINVAMGFRPHRTYTGWQAPIDDVLAAIGNRGSSTGQ